MAPHGAIAQLVERFHGMEEVRGSIPLSSTEEGLVTDQAFVRFALPRSGQDAVAVSAARMAWRWWLGLTPYRRLKAVLRANGLP